MKTIKKHYFAALAISAMSLICAAPASAQTVDAPVNPITLTAQSSQTASAANKTPRRVIRVVRKTTETSTETYKSASRGRVIIGRNVSSHGIKTFKPRKTTARMKVLYSE